MTHDRKMKELHKQWNADIERLSRKQADPFVDFFNFCARKLRSALNKDTTKDNTREP